MKQCPTLGLWIVLFEVGKKGIISEMLKARGIVAHDVSLSWEILADVAVAVLTLVKASKAAELESRARRRDRPLGRAGYRWRVITHVLHRGVDHIVG